MTNGELVHAMIRVPRLGPKERILIVVIAAIVVYVGLQLWWREPVLAGANSTPADTMCVASRIGLPCGF